MKITLRDCSLLSGAVVRTGTRLRITGVSTDSRKVNKGNIFFALRGEKFDGHQYCREAFQQGASVVIVEKAWLEANEEISRALTIPIVAVPDTTKALGELAGIYRKKFSLPILAIGGSNGKTTTKEMIASVLRTKYTVLSTEGNLNNHIGVPQMLFRLMPKHDIAVLELGTNHPGELEYLCSIVRPTHALITNIGREHLEFFIDERGVAQEETELFRVVEKEGTAFVNLDDQFLAPLLKKMRHAVSYGAAPRAAVRGMKMKLNNYAQPFFELRVKGKKGQLVQLSAAGMHNVSNALAAGAVGTEFRVPVIKIVEALEQFNAAQKRMEVIRWNGIVILNDTYNANPDSMTAALKTLAAVRVQGKKVVVLGDMFELGLNSIEEHRRIGELVRKMKFEDFFTVGMLTMNMHNGSSTGGQHYESKEELIRTLRQILRPGDAMLVKGSRGMKMEEVVAQFSGQH